MDTTGSSKEKDPEPEDPTPPEGWTQNPYVQVEGGFVAGVSLGLVPFGGVGQQVLDAAEVLPHGTPEARRGLAVGQIVGGLITLVGGLTGEVAGGRPCNHDGHRRRCRGAHDRGLRNPCCRRGGEYRGRDPGAYAVNDVDGVRELRPAGDGA